MINYTEVQALCRSTEKGLKLNTTSNHQYLSMIYIIFPFFLMVHMQNFRVSGSKLMKECQLDRRWVWSMCGGMLVFETGSQVDQKGNNFEIGQKCV